MFSKFAMTVTIPLYMVVSMMNPIAKADLLQLGIAVTMPMLTMLVTYVIGTLNNLLYYSRSGLPPRDVPGDVLRRQHSVHRFSCDHRAIR